MRRGRGEEMMRGENFPVDEDEDSGRGGKTWREGWRR
jgi:hypothetical protein